MSDLERLLLQYLAAALGGFYFVRVYALSIKTALGVAAGFLLFLLFVYFQMSDDFHSAFNTFFIISPVLLAFLLVTLEPRTMRVNQQHLAVLCLTIWYLIYDLQLLDEQFLIGTTSIASALAIYMIVRRRPLSPLQRICSYVLSAILMGWLGIYFFAVFAEAWRTELVTDDAISILFVTSLLYFIIMILATERFASLVMLLPKKREQEYLERVRKETIPWLLAKFDPRSSVPKQTLAALFVHFVILGLNVALDIVDPTFMAGFAIIVLPVIYERFTSTRVRP